MSYLFNNKIYNKYLCLYTVGYEQTLPSHLYGPTIRSGYMLHYIHSGKGTFWCNNNVYQLGPGDFFFISPDSVVKYQADHLEPWCYYWIGFKGEMVEHYLEKTFISSKQPTFSTQNGAREVKDKVSEIIEICLTEENNDTLLNAKLLEIFHYLEKAYPKVKPKKQHSPSSILIQALQVLKNNYENNLKISELARELSVDRSYLHRLFKEEFGMGPKEYLTDLRMRKARELLTNTNVPINIISQSVGYDDPQRFSKFFKKSTSASPKDYRKTHSK